MLQNWKDFSVKSVRNPAGKGLQKYLVYRKNENHVFGEAGRARVRNVVFIFIPKKTGQHVWPPILQLFNCFPLRVRMPTLVHIFRGGNVAVKWEGKRV
jgi:hypothetical protein